MPCSLFYPVRTLFYPNSQTRQLWKLFLPCHIRMGCVWSALHSREVRVALEKPLIPHRHHLHTLPPLRFTHTLLSFPLADPGTCTQHTSHTDSRKLGPRYRSQKQVHNTCSTQSHVQDSLLTHHTPRDTWEHTLTHADSHACHTLTHMLSQSPTYHTDALRH